MVLVAHQLHTTCSLTWVIEKCRLSQCQQGKCCQGNESWQKEDAGKENTSLSERGPPGSGPSLPGSCIPQEFHPKVKLNSDKVGWHTCKETLIQTWRALPKNVAWEIVGGSRRGYYSSLTNLLADAINKSSCQTRFREGTIRQLHNATCRGEA